MAHRVCFALRPWSNDASSSGRTRRIPYRYGRFRDHRLSEDFGGIFPSTQRTKENNKFDLSLRSFDAALSPGVPEAAEFSPDFPENVELFDSVVACDGDAGCRPPGPAKRRWASSLAARPAQSEEGAREKGAFSNGLFSIGVEFAHEEYPSERRRKDSRREEEGCGRGVHDVFGDAAEKHGKPIGKNTATLVRRDDDPV